jgi:TPP-dependent pyruvate/acetoin dehydrogenase alpha subunit
MKLDGSDRLAAAVFGDGVSSRGDIHEAMNLASVQTLPMIFVCQNNQYAISTAAGSGVGGEIVKRAEGYGMPGFLVDGNDLEAVVAAMTEASERARSGRGPSLLELRTYRVAGHFYSDTEDYRDPEEVNRWRERDPIQSVRQSLLSAKALSEQEIDQMENEVESEITLAFEAARNDPEPTMSDLDPDAVFASPLRRSA